MKKTTLHIEYDYNFGLLGLVASCKDYKLAWALNKHFNLRLVKQQDLLYDFQQRGALLISNYLYSSDHSLLRLFRNKSVGISTHTKPFLLPEIKEYDYIIQVDGLLKELQLEELYQTLQRLSLVQYVKQFNPQNLTCKENLIL
ncbi:MAG: IPExxxVDY family protein [Hymenobacteraceae bacterium]|nr:IPExxxVDY family protein [Hymenobacteraceae bacterium]MDX5395586.1 IPExxxVDY family protein [Hymenobacteraceae bacterium]MDX5443181.1 IPExxxVDY family protein [Hymenobacteraceae bacterium]MDX5511638.1 IPExxxVDY family protein [Hymenobacteraceae bacterium]